MKKIIFGGISDFMMSGKFIFAMPGVLLVMIFMLAWLPFFFKAYGLN